MDNDEGLKINDNKQKVVDLQNDEWQRLSLISIVYFTVHGLFNFGNALFYLIPAIALNFDKIKENPQGSLAVASAILLIFVVMGCLNYWFYRFIN